MAVIDTTTYTAGPVHYGRSGYNKDDTDNTPVNKGRSGYNKDDDETKNQGRSGYNKDDDEPKNQGRSGYNRSGEDDTPIRAAAATTKPGFPASSFARV